MLILGLSAISIALSFWTLRQENKPVWRFRLPPVPPQKTPFFETLFEYEVEQGQAHAPSIIEDEGYSTLMWFEGSAEAQADVDLYTMRLEKSDTAWAAGQIRARITRPDLGDALEPRQLVVTLGNCVEAGRNNEVFATIVSIGGWAMASIAAIRLDPDGPVTGRKLNLSPFLGRSNLVKATPVFFEDGDRGLPSYFELGSAFGLLARLDNKGRVRDAIRITGEGKPIQPMIVALDALNAVAFLRDFDGGGALLISHSNDGGRSWSAAAPAGLANPNAPVSALRLEQDLLLVAANDEAGAAARLCLLTYRPSDATWCHLHEVEPASAYARYPVLRVEEDGSILLAYSTGHKTGLKLQRFSRSWAEAAAL